jgi:uncharacterized protein (DUF4415 family)
MPSIKRAKKLWTKRELEEQHRRDRQAGVAEEFLYRPDRTVPVPKAQRHDAKPGETDLQNVKVAIHIKLDADVIEFFKARASEPNAAPYQTQINSALREFIEDRPAQAPEHLVEAVAGRLLRDSTFIQSVRGKTRRRA